MVQRLAKPADKYGAAFYCSRDLVGVSTMLALTVGLRSGLDVQSWLEGLGFGAALAGETAASLASGALVSFMYKRRSFTRKMKILLLKTDDLCDRWRRCPRRCTCFHAARLCKYTSSPYHYLFPGDAPDKLLVFIRPVFARWQTAVYKAVSEEVKPK